MVAVPIGRTAVIEPAVIAELVAAAPTAAPATKPAAAATQRLQRASIGVIEPNATCRCAQHQRRLRKIFMTIHPRHRSHLSRAHNAARLRCERCRVDTPTQCHRHVPRCDAGFSRWRNPDTFPRSVWSQFLRTSGFAFSKQRCLGGIETCGAVNRAARPPQAACARKSPRSPARLRCSAAAAASRASRSTRRARLASGRIAASVAADDCTASRTPGRPPASSASSRSPVRRFAVAGSARSTSRPITLPEPSQIALTAPRDRAAPACCSLRRSHCRRGTPSPRRRSRARPCRPVFDRRRQQPRAAPLPSASLPRDRTARQSRITSATMRLPPPAQDRPAPLRIIGWSTSCFWNTRAMACSDAAPAPAPRASCRPTRSRNRAA